METDLYFMAIFTMPKWKAEKMAHLFTIRTMKKETMLKPDINL